MEVVRTWVNAYNRDGLKLKSVARRPRSLSPDQESGLCGLLIQSPEKYGFFGQVWDCKTLTMVFAQTYQQEVHPDTIWRVLKRNNYRFKLPQTQHPQSNPTEKKKAIQTLKQLATTVKNTANKLFLFFDSSIVQKSGSKSAMWCKKASKTFVAQVVVNGLLLTL